MAQGRMIKTRIAKSKKFASLKTNEARMLWLMILPHLDSEGRIDADSMSLKGEVCPLLDFPLDQFQACLEDLRDVGLIQLYLVSGSQYLQFTRFHDLNYINFDREAKSHIPKPPQIPPIPESSRVTPESSSKDVLSPPASTPPNVIESKVKEIKGESRVIQSNTGVKDSFIDPKESQDQKPFSGSSSAEFKKEYDQKEKEALEKLNKENTKDSTLPKSKPTETETRKKFYEKKHKNAIAKFNQTGETPF